MRLLRAYSKDLKETAGKLNVCSETLTFIKKLRNYTISVPFLENIFIVPTEDKLIDSKVLYDQAKSKKFKELQSNIMESGELGNSYYIYSQEQYIEEWFRDNNIPMSLNVDIFDTNIEIEGLLPPTEKLGIFKWAFQIPDVHTDIN